MKCIKERSQEIKKSYYDGECGISIDIVIDEITKEYDNGKITKKYVLEQKVNGDPCWLILRESKSLDVVLKCFNERIRSQSC